MGMWLTALVIALPVALALWASLKVIRDEISERGQKAAQLALVWLVPLMGALIVLGVHRKSDKPSGKYRDRADLRDDFAMSPGALRRTFEVLDDD